MLRQNFKSLSKISSSSFYDFSSNLRSEDGLPIVNLKDPEVSQKLATALREWGFFYVTGHDVPDGVIRRAYEQSKIFFGLPLRVKRQVKANGLKQALKTVRGHTEIRGEQLNPSGEPDLKEVFDVGYPDTAVHYLGENKWPVRQSVNIPHYWSGWGPDRRPLTGIRNLTRTRDRRPLTVIKNLTGTQDRKPLTVIRNLTGKQDIRPLRKGKRDADREMKNAVDSYAEYASTLAQKILGLTAKEQGCEDDFERVFGPDSLQVQRLTRYPPTHEINDRKPGEIGAGVHSDYGGITILYAQGPGLYVLKPNKTSEYVERGTFSPELEVPNSDQWIEVDSLDDTFIVMAGEALQRLSNGQIYAVKHKVEFSSSMPRYSLAFFYDPNPEAVLEPLKCFVKSNLPLYQAKVAGHKGVTRNLVDKRIVR